MTRVVVPPKIVSETRIDQLDYSSQLPAGVVVSSATGSSSVYSGTDPSPSSIIASVTTTGLQYVYVKVTGGVLGTIYQLNVLATCSDAVVRSITYFLAIIPDVT